MERKGPARRKAGWPLVLEADFVSPPDKLARRAVGPPGDPKQHAAWADGPFGPWAEEGAELAVQKDGFEVGCNTSIREVLLVVVTNSLQRREFVYGEEGDTSPRGVHYQRLLVLKASTIFCRRYIHADSCCYGHRSKINSWSCLEQHVGRTRLREPGPGDRAGYFFPRIEVGVFRGNGLGGGESDVGGVVGLGGDGGCK